MKTIKLDNNELVQVSNEIYKIDGETGLYRKINGLDGHQELGWHWKGGWNCFIAVSMCYDGVDRSSAYKGVQLTRVSEYHTHPLNHYCKNNR